MPGRVAAPLGILLPLTELAIAASFLFAGAAWWGAVGAALLLIIFSLGIAVNLLLGRHPECNCFGQLNSSPIGWGAVARNLAMAGAAGWLVWAGAGARFSMLDWELSPEVRWPLLAVVLVGAALAVIAWLFMHLAKQNGRLLLRVEAIEARLASMGHSIESQATPMSDPGVGATAPPFQLSGLYGEVLTLKALQAQGKLLLLVFSDPECGPCVALMPHIARWQLEFSAMLNIVVISRGSAEANRAKAEGHNVTQILLQKDREIAEAYSCAGTPGAVLVRPDGLVASPIAMGADAITALVNRTVGAQRRIAAVPELRPRAPQPVSLQPLKIGEKPPRLGLPDLEGQPIEFGNSQSLSNSAPVLESCVRFLQRYARRSQGVGIEPARGLAALADGLGRVPPGKCRHGNSCRRSCWIRISQLDNSSAQAELRRRLFSTLTVPLFPRLQVARQR